MPYWVDVHVDGRVGAGFLLNRVYVLTARHCLPDDLAPPDGRVEVALRDDVPPHAELRLRGRLCATADKDDLALIMLDDSRTAQITGLPEVDRAHGTPPWRSPYRSAELIASLSGRVTDACFQHMCEAGGTVEALQLRADQHLGDFAGYSGGPVEAESGVGDWPVVGILLEQLPDRHSPRRAANVLVAATIRHALACFPQLDLRNLIPLLRAEDDSLPMNATALAPDPEHVRDETDTFLADLRRRVEAGLIDPSAAQQFQLRLLERDLDSRWGRGRLD